MPNLHLLKDQLKTGLAVGSFIISLIALYYTGLNSYRQTRESEMQLWSSLRHEFDYDLLKDRRDFANAFIEGKLEDHYTRVMDFFDTLGFLVKTKRVDPDLFINTWGYYFSGYYQATKSYIEEDVKKDPATYSGVIYLAKRFSMSPELQKPDDIKTFFEDEQGLPK